MPPATQETLLGPENQPATATGQVACQHDGVRRQQAAHRGRGMGAAPWQAGAIVLVSGADDACLAMIQCRAFKATDAHEDKPFNAVTIDAARARDNNLQWIA